MTNFCFKLAAVGFVLLSSAYNDVHGWTTPSVLGNSRLQPFNAVDRNSRVSRLSLRSSSPLLTAGSKLTSSASATALQADLSSVPSAALDSNALLTFFIQTLISYGVPAVLSIVVIAFAASSFRKAQKDKSNVSADGLLKSDTAVAQLYNDLYGNQGQSSVGKGGDNMLKQLFSDGKSKTTLPKNVGVPSVEYIRMTNLNSKLDSYKYTLKSATQSKAKAAADFRQKSFERAWGKALSSGGSAAVSSDNVAFDANEHEAIEPFVSQQLESAERDFLTKGDKLVKIIQGLQALLTVDTVDEELVAMGMTSVYELDPNLKTNATNAGSKKENKKMEKNAMKSKRENMKELSIAQEELQSLELDFVKKVVQAVGPGRAAAVRAALLGDMTARGSGGLLMSLQERPLTSLLTKVSDSKIEEGAADADSIEQKSIANAGFSKPILYTCKFIGDVSASQVSDLREEVTAILSQARPGIDEVVVVLQTGGGTVTGYGLGAAQLLRLKDAGLHLTIAVEQVAASGGYMMSCVADKIVASPFAVLGSIGVISEVPNVYERLKQEGIEFQSITAGKYKRTLTPTKKVTREDYEKSKADVEDIFLLFRDFVKENRPSLDIDKVATGETWFGSAALDRNLCDELITADKLLVDYVDKGFDVFEVKYAPPPENELQRLGQLLPVGQSTESPSLIRKSIQWLVRAFAAEIRNELDAAGGGVAGSLNNRPIQERYMAVDDQADRIRAQD